MACDKENRHAIDIAARPHCQQVIRLSTYLFKRFETTTTVPHHESSTCLLYICKDHATPDQTLVALKFLVHRDQWLREITVRNTCDLDPAMVMEIIDTFDSLTDPEIRSELTRKGFSKYPYVIVMPAGKFLLAYLSCPTIVIIRYN